MATAPAANRPWRKGLPIVAYLIFGVGGLIVLSVGGVFLLTLSIATRNTLELLGDNGRLLISSTVRQVRQFLEPPEAQIEMLGRLIEGGRVDPSDPERLFAALEASLAASPQVRSTVFLDPSGWLMAAVRTGPVPHPEIDEWSSSPDASKAMADARGRGRKAYWGAPIYLKDPGVTVVNLRRPVIVGGRMRGLLASTITIQELSRFITDLESETGQNAFILYDRDKVLAHNVLRMPFPGLGVERPLPRVTEIGDPVLFQIWREGWQDRKLEVEVPGHWDRLGGTQYIYLYRELERTGDPPWLVGSYFAAEAIDQQLERLLLALGLGLLALAAAVVVALLLGRRVSRPVTRLAEAAGAIRTLDLDDLPPLRRSRLREIDQAASAFNAMVRTLRVFATYVPKPLVQSLISEGIVASLASESREVTVLFTDIVDFTGRIENLSAEETAEFLNHHFGLLTGCIEAEGGTVDKYIGDALMALWNAIDDQPDHALRAARAAGAIANAIREDNRERPIPIRMRIALHSGPVVVGNIGATSRVNYTVVGDTVNTAQRLLELAKDLLPDAEVAVLLSAESGRALPRDMAVRSLGRHRLRGRDAPIEVLLLET